MEPKTEVISIQAEDQGNARDQMSWKEKKELRALGKPYFPKKKDIKKSEDPFPEKLQVSETSMKRHDAGIDEFDPSKMRNKLSQKRAEKKKEKFKQRQEEAARAELLNNEYDGFLEADDGQLTAGISQREIVASVDLASASKHFDLHLAQFGPYRIDYTDNGRHLVLGGRKGHIAAFDWFTKKLHTENNVMEGVRDVKWLHTENMFAVSQKAYTYVYDNQGTELHCVKQFFEVNRLAFLPRHFLLVGAGRNSFLRWLDVSVGQMVTETPTKTGPLDAMCQNPANAIIHTGHGNGTVSLWSPSVAEPLVKMIAHSGSIRGIAVSENGNYMVTTGVDRKCRVWDIRMYRQLHAYTMFNNLGQVAISHRNVVACGVGNTVQLFKDMHTGHATVPYLQHRCGGVISDLKFVPYEDVLGIGHAGGFTSILVPGSGEANVDALRANPYETTKQKREREVKQLLEKIPSDLICIDPDEIGRVDTEALEKNVEAKKQMLWLNQPAITFKPRHKTKGKGSTLRTVMRRDGVKLKKRFERNEMIKEIAEEFLGKKPEKVDDGPKHVLDRFKANK